jgi:hypothetical protein
LKMKLNVIEPFRFFCCCKKKKEENVWGRFEGLGVCVRLQKRKLIDEFFIFLIKKYYYYSSIGMCVWVTNMFFVFLTKIEGEYVCPTSCVINWLIRKLREKKKERVSECIRMRVCCCGIGCFALQIFHYTAAIFTKYKETWQKKPIFGYM